MIFVPKKKIQRILSFWIKQMRFKKVKTITSVNILLNQNWSLWLADFICFTGDHEQAIGDLYVRSFSDELKENATEKLFGMLSVFTHIEISPKTLHVNSILCYSYILDIQNWRFFIFESALKISRPPKWNYHLILFTILVFDES